MSLMVEGEKECLSKSSVNNQLSGPRFKGSSLLLVAIFLFSEGWLVWLAAINTTPGQVFLGYPHIPTDHYAYKMMTEQSREDGRFFTDNMFTTQEQDGRYLMSGLSVTGWIEALFPRAAHAWIWHSLRLLALAAFCVVLLKLCQSLFGGRTLVALLAFAALLFSQGIDWLWRLFVSKGLISMPGGQWLENPWNFNLLWTGTLATWVWPVMILTGMIVLEIRKPREDLLRGLLRGLAFAALFSVHPYTALFYLAFTVLIIVFGGIGESPWKQRIIASLKANVGILVGVVLVGIYALWARDDTVYRLGSDQVRLWRLWYWPHLWPVVYGPQLVFAVFGLLADFGRGGRVVKLWLVAALLMSLNPMVTGAKFQFLATIPLILLEVAGVSYLFGRFPKARLLKVGVALIAVLSLGGYVEAMTSDLRAPEVVDASEASPDMLKTLEFLRTQTEGGVLCHPTDGTIVPWKAHKTVFVGQWFLSTRFYEKVDLVRWFVQGPASDEARLDFLAAAHIAYVLDSPRLRSFGAVPEIDGLVEIFRTDSVRLLTVSNFDRSKNQQTD